MHNIALGWVGSLDPELCFTLYWLLQIVEKYIIAVITPVQKFNILFIFFLGGRGGLGP